MHLKRTLLTLGVGAAALTLAGTSSALGLSHTVVTVGGSGTVGDVAVTGDNTSPIEFDTDWDVHTECSESAITGTIKRGASVAVGTTVGAITDLTFSDCLVGGGMPVVIELVDDAEFVVDAHPANAGDPIAVRIEGIDAHMHSPGSTTWACEVAATGSVEATITPGAGGVDGTVSINPGSFELDLVALNGAGTGTPSGSGLSCAGQIGTGDVATMDGDFVLDSTGVISHS